MDKAGGMLEASVGGQTFKVRLLDQAGRCLHFSAFRPHASRAKGLQSIGGWRS
jgi:hypothetical protein